MKPLLVLVTVGLWLLASEELPRGYQEATWGMTVAELQEKVPVQKVEEGDIYGFAEHGEVDPEVYVQVTPERLRVEYYFFEGRLYKIFLIYHPSRYSLDFYRNLVRELTRRYGPAHRTYTEQIMGLSIRHTVWEDEVSRLDLRMGAGFIYQVREDRAAAARKARQQRLKQSI